MILKHGMHHWELQFYKVYINDNPGLTMTYSTAGSNWVVYTFKSKKKLLQSHLMGETCSKGLNLLNNCVTEKHLTPGDGLPLPWYYNHVQDHLELLTPEGEVQGSNRTTAV